MLHGIAMLLFVSQFSLYIVRFLQLRHKKERCNTHVASQKAQSFPECMIIGKCGGFLAALEAFRLKSNVNKILLSLVFL